ncbi:hypothetical protein AXF42_Ash010697 [Apostasia shenzhenica]|uniref:Uncharacterized protein n=1 Tax=Apostasia shenzhenica TaxID=1088818 RepID=A0A2I0A6U8_9ASPA|nr:hypothetical protein AXF42_Ash010697 [Apostasia shenzhenica]
MMASACINNVAVTPENFLDCSPAYPAYGWLSPRISFSRDIADEGGRSEPEKQVPASIKAEESDLTGSSNDFVDFEFRLDDPVTMLSADELFSEGKLVPLQLAHARSSAEVNSEIRSSEPSNLGRIGITGPDLYAFSPKAPRCSSRWKELLGLKKVQGPKLEIQKVVSCNAKSSSSNRSLKHFLHRSTKASSIDSSLSLPLLRDSDFELASLSSRASLSSSSSSGADYEDLPRLSLDSDKLNPVPISLCRNPPRIRLSKARSMVVDGPIATVGGWRTIRRATESHAFEHLEERAGRSVIQRTVESAGDGPMVVRVGRCPIRRAPEAVDLPPHRGASVDSPRLNASGKVIFQGLERSSSSPSTFNGGPRPRPRGMERSYSANVRITPVLNVPVCTLRGSSKSVSVLGFGQLFSPQKKEKEGPSSKNLTGSNSCSSIGSKTKNEKHTRPETN